MNLVTNHMLQALIVGWVQENHDFHTLASETIVHDFIAVSLIAQVMELVRDVLDSLALEWGRITFVTIQTSDLTQDSLDQMTNSHTRGDSVRVDNHVGHDTFNRKGQVFLSISHTNCSFLSMTTCKLVTNLRHLNGSHLDFD